jgi:lipocalin-like protein
MHRALPFLALLASISAAAGETPSASPSTSMRGTWKVAQIRVDVPAGSSVVSAPQAGLFIFTKSHYSAVWVPVQERPASFATSWALTPDEMVASYKSLVAHTGTYEVDSSVITMHAEQAKNPAFAGGRISYDYRLEGNVLHLTQTAIVYPNGQSHPRVKEEPQTIKLLRVEEP